MGWQEIRRHTDQVEMFRRTIARGRLGQAYLFVGPEGIGKKRFALLLARSLFCQTNSEAALDPCGRCPACKQVIALTHPDLFLVERPKDKHELTIELFVGSKERRGREGLCHDLSLKPMSAERKMAIIDEADLLNLASSNALLKTLEEPPPKSLIILIVANAEGLLPTIRSRCQEINFSPLTEQDVAELLVEHAMLDDPREAAEVAEICEGSLALAVQLCDPQLRSQRQQIYDALSAGNFDSVEAGKRVMECVEAAGTESVVQRQRAGWLLRFCVDFYRRVIIKLGHTSSVATESAFPQIAGFCARLDPDASETLEIIGNLLERVIEAQIQLDRKMAIGLCVEVLFDDLGKMTRP